MGSRESCVHFRAHPAEAMCLPQSEAHQRHNKKCDMCSFFFSMVSSRIFIRNHDIIGLEKAHAKPMNGMMILQPVPQGWDLRILVDFQFVLLEGFSYCIMLSFLCVCFFFSPFFLVPPTVPCSLFLSKFGIIFGIFAGPDELCERTLCVCAELSNQLIFLGIYPGNLGTPK